MKTVKRYSLCALVIAIAPMLSACPKKEDNGAAASSPKKGETALETVWTEFDKFEAQLMERARKVIGDSDDYRIFVMTLDYPIGTPLRMDKVIPIAECKPPTPPTSAPAPTMFPDYKLSKSLAISLGLDNAVLTQIAELGASAKDADTFSYQIKEPVVTVLNDKHLKELVAQKECLEAMGGQPVRMVRGTVSGQRDFVLSTTTTGELKGKVAKVGSFDVSGGIGNSDISIKDSSPKAFLQIVSLVTPPAAGSESAKPAATVSALPVAPPASSGSSPDLGKVYVQQDKTDTADTKSVISGLQKTFSVASAVEKIDTSKMPKDPQVRYFNDQDRAKAEQIAAELKTKGYATAAPVRLGLPAPSGQVEVWLPKNPAAELLKPKLTMLVK